MKYFAVIVAGGSGERMQSDIPKQFMLLNDQPILFHTINVFHDCGVETNIILVIHPSHQARWNDLCALHNFTTPYTLADGGTERFYSVKNGLNLVEENSVVAIHDAVRPLVSKKLIYNSFLQAKEKGSAIPVIKPTESIRYQDKAINRDAVQLIQTPQTFTSNLIKSAYRQDYQPKFTDDATVVESMEVELNFIEGEKSNIKITHPEDLKWAEIYLKA